MRAKAACDAAGLGATVVMRSSTSASQMENSCSHSVIGFYRSNQCQISASATFLFPGASREAAHAVMIGVPRMTRLI